ncbi:MAG: glycosyltransferase family 1 protein [Candidatus Cloacimonadota bacterium]|nr:MAG: glycosyltransferase family 1 protein [Candidatus Cloacimonadota bacterium]
MKVAIISVRTFQYGGVERYAYELVNHLSDHVTVHLFTSKLEGDVTAKVHLVPAVGRKDLVSVNSFMLFLKSHLKRKSFDIIHSMGPLYLHPDIVTAHICQKRLLHDKALFEDFTIKRRAYWKVRTQAASRFQKMSFKNAGTVIAVSSMLKEELEKAYGIKNITVIHPGISAEFFHSGSGEERRKGREKLGFDHNSFIILFVGSQWERKGLKFALQALSLLNGNAKLLVVGKGDKLIFKRIAEKYGVTNRVRFAGFQRNIVDSYRISDMLILPSLYEPFGYPVLEAMAMGLPVVTCKSVGASELVEEGRTGYVADKPTDVKQLSLMIKKVMNGSQKTYSTAAKERAHQFLWEKKIHQIKPLYDEIHQSKLTE